MAQVVAEHRLQESEDFHLMEEPENLPRVYIENCLDGQVQDTATIDLTGFYPFVHLKVQNN